MGAAGSVDVVFDAPVLDEHLGFERLSKIQPLRSADVDRVGAVATLR
ncbi:hypothetical protein [Rhabdothermincola sp.]